MIINKINNINKTINTNTNILSYFIKDIKDPYERAFYKQINNADMIEIFYKDKILYRIGIRNYIPNTIWNYKNNILIDFYFGRIITYKFTLEIRYNQKRLYYKQDKILGRDNFNYICYSFIYKKYLSKIYFSYVFEDEFLLNIRIKYYNGYKYLFRCNNFKYNYIHVFIMNKYEFHYAKSFFSIYN